MDVTVNTPSIEIVQVHNADSPNYLFIDLKIGKEAHQGIIKLRFTDKNDRIFTYDYELKSRIKSEDYIGFNSEDVIYLITPDGLRMAIQIMILFRA